MGFAGFCDVVTGPRTLAALRLSFVTSLFAAASQCLVRPDRRLGAGALSFPGRRLLDAFVDLPFALPTAVAGIALTALYAPNGWIGRLARAARHQGRLHAAGIVVALIFIGLPFVVRTVQPVLEEFERELEEAAATLGANRRQTVLRVILPALTPAILTGFALAFARAVGEYGSVIFIAGNMPNRLGDRAAPHHHQARGVQISAAAAIATVMLMIAFAILLFINLIQAWARQRFGQ